MSNQLLGPDDSSVEAGFDPIGADMSGLASTSAPASQGITMPGGFPGYQGGINMSGMASSDSIPQANNMGVAGNDGLPDRDGDLASSAGYHLVTSFAEMFGSGYTGTTPAPQGEQDSDRS